LLEIEPAFLATSQAETTPYPVGAGMPAGILQTARSMLSCHTTCLSGKREINRATRAFNLSILVHSVQLEEMDGAGLVQTQQPFVSIGVGDSSRETEIGFWNKEKGQWTFREAIMMEVTTGDVIDVGVSSAPRYKLVASIQAPRCVAERRVSVVEVLPRLRTDDRDADGIVYATPVIGFDLARDGKTVGRAFLSFETKTPLPLYCQHAETAGLTDFGSGADWDGPLGWDAKTAGLTDFDSGADWDGPIATDPWVGA